MCPPPWEYTPSYTCGSDASHGLLHVGWDRKAPQACGLEKHLAQESPRKGIHHGKDCHFHFYVKRQKEQRDLVHKAMKLFVILVSNVEVHFPSQVLGGKRINRIEISQCRKYPSLYFGLSAASKND